MADLVLLIIKAYSAGIIGTLILFAADKIGLYEKRRTFV